MLRLVHSNGADDRSLTAMSVKFSSNPSVAAPDNLTQLRTVENGKLVVNPIAVR